MKKYKTIYADPPWNETGGGKIKRGADRHYDLMKIEEIMSLSDMIDNLKHPDGCHLYLWATNNFLRDAFKVIDAWGFEYITMVTWVKKGKIGLGQYYRGLTEHCLFSATPKRLPYRKLESGKRAQGKTAFTEKRTKHSEKPYKMREWIEDVSHPPRIELFARKKTKGWDVWGDEVPDKKIETKLKDFQADGNCE